MHLFPASDRSCRGQTIHDGHLAVHEDKVIVSDFEHFRSIPDNRTVTEFISGLVMGLVVSELVRKERGVQVAVQGSEANCPIYP